MPDSNRPPRAQIQNPSDEDLEDMLNSLQPDAFLFLVEPEGELEDESVSNAAAIRDAAQALGLSASTDWPEVSDALAQAGYHEVRVTHGVNTSQFFLSEQALDRHSWLDAYLSQN
ncbi:hypothetical protein [Deinococcus navajonensis]|uniref:Uncharacterized protein n=1 Tax=Deinococcus navajonensis TaxID=309884 RepID=A0ABV8XM14_9DEIO